MKRSRTRTVFAARCLLASSMFVLLSVVSTSCAKPRKRGCVEQNEQVLQEVIEGEVPPATEAWMREVGRDCGWIEENE